MPPTLTTCWTSTHLRPFFLDDDSSFSNWRFPPLAAVGRQWQEEEEEEEDWRLPPRPSPLVLLLSSSLLARGLVKYHASVGLEEEAD